MTFILDTWSTCALRPVVFVLSQVPNNLAFLKTCLSYKAAVRAGATGAIAPVNFQKYFNAPLNFEGENG